MTSYSYTAYGLQFTSSFPLPELLPAIGGHPDITVSYDKVPDTLAMPSNNGIAWQSSPGQLLLSVSEVARYLILENREIRIEPLPGSNENDVRIFLLGSVLGALLHARQMLVLHAGVIQTKNGAVIFMGRSGGGKSTLVGAFLQRGYHMLADDKAGIMINAQDVAEAMPGFPLVRLSKDSVNAIQFPVQGIRFSDGLGKYVIPVENFCTTPLAVYAAYSLNVHNQDEILFERQETFETFEVLNHSTYRRRFLERAEQRQAHFQILSALAGQARVTRIVRPNDTTRIDELVDRIEEDMMQ